MSRQQGAVAQQIYRAFYERPEANRRSGLHDSYRRGLAGMTGPPPSHFNQSAAWRAGVHHRFAIRALVAFARWACS